MLLDELRGGSLTEEGVGWASRRALTQTKTRRQPDQDRDEKEQPADDEAQHQSSAGLLRCSYCPPMVTP